MELNLSLFVHGVPKGQKIWGPQEDDRLYIESFYGRKTDVSVQLLVETFRIGDSINCYYTYLRSGNLKDKDGRAGSYFALTVRVNAYYSDVSNMYNILDAAYRKFIIGTILVDKAAFTNFNVLDFEDVSAKLSDLEKEIVGYIGQFSVDSDFVSLDGFVVNPKTEIKGVNLYECNSENLLSHVKTNGNVSVSPMYPMIELMNLTLQKESEIEQVKKNAQIDKDNAINAVKEEYASSGQTISTLSQKLSDLNGKLEKKGVDCSKLEAEILKLKESNQRMQTELISKEEEFGKMVATKLIVIDKALLELKEAVKMDIIPSTNKLSNICKKVHWKVILNAFHLIVSLIVMSILMLVVWSNNEPSNSKLVNKDELKTEIQALENNIMKKCEKLVGFVKSKKYGQTTSFNSSYPNARIDIYELSSENPNMKKNANYTVSIKNADNNLNGEWEAEDCTINGNTITPLNAGKCVIFYKVDGTRVLSRTITVIE